MKKLFKVVAGLVGVVAVAGAGYLAYDHFYGDHEATPVDEVIDEEVIEDVEETPVEDVTPVVDETTEETTEPEL